MGELLGGRVVDPTHRSQTVSASTQRKRETMDSLLPEPPSGSDSPSANLTESKHVVLSLRCQPYKSIMQAHFHLLGPCPSSLKARDKFMKSLEKELATRVLEMLQSNGESVKLFKLVRFTSDVEEVDEEWAIKSECMAYHIEVSDYLRAAI